MKSLNTLGLATLCPEELAHIVGGAGELSVAVKAAPQKGALDLIYKGDRGYVSGKVSLSGKDWSAGFGGGLKLGKATLEGAFTTNLNAWEVQASLRIPLGRS